jgi:hypothetical protein
MLLGFAKNRAEDRGTSDAPLWDPSGAALDASRRAVYSLGYSNPISSNPINSISGGRHEHRHFQTEAWQRVEGVSGQETSHADRRQMGRGQERQDVRGRGSGDARSHRPRPGGRQSRHRPRGGGGSEGVRNRPVVAHLARRALEARVEARRPARTARRRVRGDRGARQWQAGHQRAPRRRRRLSRHVPLHGWMVNASDRRDHSGVEPGQLARLYPAPAGRRRRADLPGIFRS